MTTPSPEYLAEIDAWRRRRLSRLTAPDGWLSLVGLCWLRPGENRIGTDASADVRVPDARASGSIGTLHVDGVEARLETAGSTRPLRPEAGSELMFFREGPLALSLIRRGDRLAVRVRDADSRTRRRFRGLTFFPIDPDWRIAAAFEPYDPPRRVQVPTVLGTLEEEVAPGAVIFEAAGETHRLEPILERGQTDYWIIFGDATNGKETYGAGRFVYVPPPAEGRTILDFNKAYNPPCVFSPHSTCPLPPPGNRLPFRVEGGERTYEP